GTRAADVALAPLLGIPDVQHLHARVARAALRELRRTEALDALDGASLLDPGPHASREEGGARDHPDRSREPRCPPAVLLALSDQHHLRVGVDHPGEPRP